MKKCSVATANLPVRVAFAALAMVSCARTHSQGSSGTEVPPASSPGARTSGSANLDEPAPERREAGASSQSDDDAPTPLELYPKLDYLTGLLGDVPTSEPLLQLGKLDPDPVEELPPPCRHLPQQLLRESLWVRCVPSPSGGVWLVQARAIRTEQEERGNYRVGFSRGGKTGWGPERPYHVLFNGYSLAAPPARAIFLDHDGDGTHEAALLGYDGVNASDVGERTLSLYRLERGRPVLLKFTEDRAAFALTDCNADGRPELYYDPYRPFESEVSLSFGFYNRRSSTAWSLLTETGPGGATPDTPLARAYASSLCSDVGPEPIERRRPGEWPHVLHCQLLKGTDPSVLRSQVKAGCSRADEEVARFCSYNQTRLLEMTTTQLPFQLAGAKNPGAPQCLLPPIDQ